MTAIRKIEAAGFTLKLRDSRLVVSPADKLTAEQRAFIRANKSALMATLAARVSTEVKPVSAPEYVSCASCRHSLLSANTEPVYGWRSCGLDLPDGGGFGQALRRCAEWEKQP